MACTYLLQQLHLPEDGLRGFDPWALDLVGDVCYGEGRHDDCSVIEWGTIARMPKNSKSKLYEVLFY